jgi:uncharacterized membrane protein YjdF
VAPVFLIPILWAPYFLRNKIALHPFHYALFASAVLLHNLGAFGFYQKSPFGQFSFDIVVHYWFGVVGTLLLYRGFREVVKLGPVAAEIAALMFVMGFGAIHEIMEYCSYLMLGEETGMLKPATSYFFDTQRDLLNNLLGGLTAIGGYLLHFLLTRRKHGRGAHATAAVT